MKKAFITVLFSAALLAGCNKDKDKKADVYLLQEMETPIAKVNFSYNDQNLATKMEMGQKQENGSFKPQGYIDFHYNNSYPASAEIYVPVAGGSSFRKEASIRFALTAQNNIAYAAFQGYDEDGQPDGDSKDTSFLEFNANNQLVSVSNGIMGGMDMKLGYDSRGNLNLQGYTSTDGDEKHSYSFEHSYDGNVNPFRYNGLGILMMTLGFGEIEMVDQLLSYNNSLMLKLKGKTEHLNGGSVESTDYFTQTFSRAFTYDQNNVPKAATVTFSIRTENAGEAPVEPTPMSAEYKYTIIKK